MNSATSTQTKRRHLRREFYGQIEGLVRGSAFYATIQNIGMGGVCFEVDYPFQVGVELDLSFRLFDRPAPRKHRAAAQHCRQAEARGQGGLSETDSDSITVKAQVVWVQPFHMLFNRVGVEFKDLNPTARRTIKAYVSRLKIDPARDGSGAGKYPLLLSPFECAGVMFKNRITMAPMFWGYAEEDGSVSQMLIQHYREVALGGAAMIVVANAVVDESGIMTSRVLRINHDRFIQGLARLAEAIKSAGAVACLQINHAGRWAKVEERLAPSPATIDVSSELGAFSGMRQGLSGASHMRFVNDFILGLMKCRRSMTLEEIMSIIRCYGQAALRAKKAGFDMVELHGATGYLLAQFLSPRQNRRHDEYGGPLENRMRFPLEVVNTVRRAVGKDFPIGYRLMADEWLADGFKVEEARIFAQHLERLGIAYLSVTAGTYESFFLPEIINQCRKEGYVSDLAGQIAEAAPDTPVIATGRIVRPGVAERILQDNEADLIGLARPLFADPLWPKKVLEGREDSIIQCKACNLCLLCAMRDQPVVCSRWDKFKVMDIDIQLKHKRKKWEKVLIAIDGSEESLRAVEYAGRMISRGHKVALFNVSIPQHNGREGRKKMEALLSRAKGHLVSMGIDENDIETKISAEKIGIAEDILEEVEMGEYGSVILGKRSVSLTRQLLFGSVSNFIVQNARDCGVWVVD